MTTFLAYVDDSGDKTGSLHTALLIPAEQWSRSLTMQIQTFTHLVPTAIKRDAYREFLRALDRALAMTDHYAMLIIDGKPGQDDHAVRDDHRDLHLRSRRILEDGWIQDAIRSQFIQMTDFVAYSAFKHREQHPDKRFMWNWYPDHMHDLEFGGSCICRP